MHGPMLLSLPGGELLDLRAKFKSANKDLPLGSVKHHLGSIGGVGASRGLVLGRRLLGFFHPLREGEQVSNLQGKTLHNT